MQRYLVLGRGKTGTTAISKTIQNTTGIGSYFLEPRSIAFFERLGNSDEDVVAKILFDQWRMRPRLLRAIINNELSTNFTNLLITRDPRAEIVSRMHYRAFRHFREADRSSSEIARWLAPFRRKEQDPETVSLREMIEALSVQIGLSPVETVDARAGAVIDYAELIAELPDAIATILRYEDFATGNLSDHPCRKILSGSREVGDRLERTRRTNGVDDWSAFYLDSDRDWIDGLAGDAVAALGYDRHAWPERRPIQPEHCSLYVERIIGEAVRNRRASTAASAELVVADDDNFDEDAYLAANPDIAAYVAAGKIESGRAHFEKSGRRAGRRQLRRG